MPSHQDYCLRVCAVCWRKAQKKGSPSEEALIKEFVISNYEIESLFFPSGICSACSRTLYQYRSGNFKIVLKVSNDFSPGLLRIKRTSAECPCRICAIANANPVLQGKGRPNGKSIRRASSGDKDLHLKTLGRPMSVKVDAKQQSPRIYFRY